MLAVAGARRLGCANRAGSLWNASTGAGAFAVPPDEAVVARAIDGDTVELAGGTRVRYIGIDTPETHRRVGDRWVDDVQPFGREAADFNRRQVEGKRVRLEYDVEPHDKYGRLLAYVYADGEMINARLLAEGYARLLTIPPNVKYADRFRALVQEARRERRGMWAAARSRSSRQGF